MQHASISYSAMPPTGGQDPQRGGRFIVDGWLADPESGHLYRNGQSIHLAPKLMQVLVYLARHPGQVISRHELETEVWKGSVVSYDAVTGVIQKLRKIINDDARHPHAIETLSKRGYRLIADVTWTDVAPVPDKPVVSSEPTDRARHRSSRRCPAAILVIMLIAVSLLIISNGQQTGRTSIPAGTTPLSIAVLPFTVMDAELTDDYFTDGLADDLTTRLARRPELLVISRESTFVYKDSTLNIRQVADLLGVRFILHGSIRKLQHVTRLNVQLTDTSTGGLLWANRYDVETSDFIGLDAAIFEEVVTSMVAAGGTGERQDLGAPLTDNMQAYENFQFGRQLFYTFASRDENRKARKYFRKAIQHDPGFAMAYSMLAWTHAFDAMNGWSESRKASLEGARDIASHALGLDPSMPVAYFVRGLSYRETGDYVKALVEAESAIRYDPNYANAHVLLATLLYYAGRPEEGLQRIRRAMLLNPHHPYNYSFHLGQAHFILGDYENAIEAFRRGIESNPASERLHVWLAAAYARAGLLEDAEWEVDQILILNPDFSTEKINRIFPFKYDKDREHFLDSLVKAGLPD